MPCWVSAWNAGSDFRSVIKCFNCCGFQFMPVGSGIRFVVGSNSSNIVFMPAHSIWLNSSFHVSLWAGAGGWI